MGNIYTIGYGNLPFIDLLNILVKFNIMILVDIRSRPFSRHRPAYQKRNLEQAVINAGMKYLYLGDKLGGMPEDRRFYDSLGNVDYGILEEEPKYLDGINQIMELSRERDISLLCAEAEPERCHRALLVSETLWKKGIESLHILHDGSALRHSILRTKFENIQGDLFEGAD
jgi:uncharacterized protein (DUF488 family)